jgi:signal transduction histidine kinase
MAVAYAVSLWRGEAKGAVDAIAAAAFLLFPGVVGVAIRFRDAAQAREIEHAKLREREQLARELHDSVAHHMTAITIQAQAARAQPSASAAALRAIEEESAKTLAELREIVGALREDESASRVPAGRIADLSAFAREAGATIAVDIELSGDFEGVPAAVERAVYRLAQESITNAIKHARGATRIKVQVAADADAVHLTAQDDGESPARRGAGFGLVGMAERAALLGGTFEAGPSASGWCVRAVLPRTGGRP